MRTYCIANKSGRFALLVNQEVVCFISFYIILWVIILLFFAKYLSLHRDIQPFAEYAVTPCMGVWIETIESVNSRICQCVTPCMGVWIETRPLSMLTLPQVVTPCMGVWIETCLRNCIASEYKSHPVWVCGLKLEGDVKMSNGRKSHPVWVCGLKLREQDD